MEYLAVEFGADYFTFWDDTFTLNKKRFLDFVDKKNKSSILRNTVYRCESRADSVSADIVFPHFVLRTYSGPLRDLDERVCFSK